MGWRNAGVCSSTAPRKLATLRARFKGGAKRCFDGRGAKHPQILSQATRSRSRVANACTVEDQTLISTALGMTLWLLLGIDTDKSDAETAVRMRIQKELLVSVEQTIKMLIYLLLCVI